MDVTSQVNLLHLPVDLTISIVTWNSRDDIGPCLDSLVAAVEGLTWSVTVVDNASLDATADWVTANYPGVAVIANAENVGYGVAHNQAMKAGVGRYHLILNPDTVCTPGSLTRMARFMDQRLEVGFTGPCILERDGSVYPSCRSFPTAGALLFRNRFLARLFPKNPYTREYLMGDLDRSSPGEVGWISGSAIMARSESIESTGLFDERFFMYCEDMDWCHRAHDAGWQVYYDPEATITHLRARSTDKAIPDMLVEHHRSMWKYYCKYDRSLHPVWWTAGVASVLTLRATVLVVRHAALRVQKFLHRILAR